MSLHQIIFTLILSVLLIGCSQTTSSNNSGQDSEWLLPEDEIVDGGPGKDGIPSIDDPIFSSVEETNYVGEDRLVIGLKIGDEVKAYPHQVLDWHEIINDQIGDITHSLTYCPLTGTGIAWNRNIAGNVTEFGVSGLLYRNNLIAYDRNSDTNWSQMQIRGVKGPHSGKFLETYHTVQTTWSTWKEMYPGSKILTTQTGYSRAYRGYAYGEEYLTKHDDILFPVKNEDDRLPNKTLVHAVIVEEPSGEEVDVRAYNISAMSDSIRVINEDYEGSQIVAAGSAKYNFTVSFLRMVEDGTLLEFTPIQNQLPVVMKDQEGNKWSIFGEAVTGPRTGEKLQSPVSYNGYWFAIADFFPITCIYPNTTCKRTIDK